MGMFESFRARQAMRQGMAELLYADQQGRMKDVAKVMVELEVREATAVIPQAMQDATQRYAVREQRPNWPVATLTVTYVPGRRGTVSVAVVDSQQNEMTFDLTHDGRAIAAIGRDLVSPRPRFVPDYNNSLVLSPSDTFFQHLGHILAEERQAHQNARKLPQPRRTITVTPCSVPVPIRQIVGR